LSHAFFIVLKKNKNKNKKKKKYKIKRKIDKRKNKMLGSKRSITYMAIYIKNKNIEKAKSNDIKDFKDISKVAWKLISSIYETG